jgi:thiamine-phosphate pyrophosphorylase
MNKFKKLTSLTITDIVALGGINKINKKKLKLTNCSGFAGISYFK